jgi:hypothetical protein
MAKGVPLKRYLADLILLLPLSVGRAAFAENQTAMHPSVPAIT